MRSKVTKKILASTPDEIRKSVREQANEMANTTENNLLIAEFMGYSVRYFGPVLYFSDEDGFIDFTGDARTFSPNLSWDDLMPVVEKIESDLIHTKFNFAVHIGKTVVDIVCVIRPAGEDPPHDIVVYKNPNNLNKIEMTYQAVVEFIKWYNQQNQ